jgi:uncharacterized protein
MVELKPLNVRCNIRCRYCYQNPQRDAGNFGVKYDLEAMKLAVEKEGVPFGLFGGEPLLVPEEHLEELWSLGFRLFGWNRIQTNGTLLNSNHVRLFKRYRVSVGISVDGPGELNDARWVGTLKATRESTERSEAAILRLCEEGLYPGLIVTLHRLNCSSDRLAKLHSWLRCMDSLGVPSTRLHLLEVDDNDSRQRLALSEVENIDVLLGLARLENELKNLRFDLFDDVRRLLVGDDRMVSCYWKGCDPYTTGAVREINGEGHSSNCGRTNKDGIEYLKADHKAFDRYLALYMTPQEAGGCKDCRFFLMCKGQCPGTSLDGDWRGKTEHCEIWKVVFQHFEEQLRLSGRTPVSVSARRRELEHHFINAWTNGQNLEMWRLLSSADRTGC